MALPFSPFGAAIQPLSRDDSAPIATPFSPFGAGADFCRCGVAGCPPPRAHDSPLTGVAERPDYARAYILIYIPTEGNTRTPWGLSGDATGVTVGRHGGAGEDFSAIGMNYFA